MAKNVNIFIVTGVFIKLDREKDLRSDMNIIVGYFTNLKVLYGSFHKDSIQSYSTITAHIRKKGYYVSKGTRFWYRRRLEKFDEIIIRKVVTNKLYFNSKSVSLSRLLAKEVSTMDIHLGMNLSGPFSLD